MKIETLLDWITGVVWCIGAMILMLWVIETVKEFRKLFSEQKESNSDQDLRIE